MIVGGRHLDDIHPHHGQFEADAPNGVEEFAATEPPGLRRPSARSVTGISHIDIHGEEDAIALVHRNGERLGEALVEAALPDLGHLI